MVANHSKTIKIKTMYGNMDLTLVYNKENKLNNIFILLGKSGTTVQAKIEAIARLVNLCLEYKIPIKEIQKHLLGIRGRHTINYDGKIFYSIPDVLSYIIFNEQELKES